MKKIIPGNQNYYSYTYRNDLGILDTKFETVAPQFSFERTNAT